MAVGAIVVLRSLDDGGVKGLSSTNGLDFESCSWGRRSREASPVQSSRTKHLGSVHSTSHQPYLSSPSAGK